MSYFPPLDSGLAPPSLSRSGFPSSSSSSLSNDEDVYRAMAFAPQQSSLPFSQLGSPYSGPFGSLDSLKPTTLTKSSMQVPVLEKSAAQPLHASGKTSAQPATNPIPASVNFSALNPSLEPQCAPCGYMEPNCHFYVNLSALIALQQLVQLLQESSVDCRVIPEEFKIKCQAYKDYQRVEFVVRVFSPDPNACFSPDKRYAIEFQRRFGDGMKFHTIYRVIKQALLNGNGKINNNSNSGSFTTTASSVNEARNSKLNSATTGMSVGAAASGVSDSFKSFTPLACLPCPNLCKIALANLEKPCVVECVSKSIQCLVQMCDTDCVDVKSQALIALAAMSERTEIHSYLVQYGAFDLFVDSIGCSFTDCNRASAAGLANLTASNRNSCDRFVHTANATDHLLQLARSRNAEVVRQSARTLANLTRQVGVSAMRSSVNPASAEYSAVIEELANSSDKFTAQQGIEMLESMSL